MADEPTSADPDALGNLVDTGAKLRAELAERAAELDALVRWVEAGSAEFGVPGMQALVDRLTALGIQWERTDAGVAAVREALLGADQFGASGFPVVTDAEAAGLVDLADGRMVDDLAADLVGQRLTGELARAVAAETIRLVEADPRLTVFEALRRASATVTGVSEGELDRRARAFGLSRGQVATVLADHWDEAERASRGYGHGVTLAGLRAVADTDGASPDLRDAAYRLASDPGLFNDLDASARTRGVTATGYDWSQVDGVIGRSDVDGFTVRDGQIRVVLPWRLLIDSAADDFRLARADGVIRGRELERFVHDRRVPAVVRQAAWELYDATDPDLTRGLRPFEPGDDERSDNGLMQAASRGLVGTLPAGAGGRSTFLTTGQGRPGGGLGGAEPGPVEPPVSAGPGGAGFAGLLAAVVAAGLEPVVDAGVDRATAAWDRARADGMPGSFVVFDPGTGRAVEVSTEALAGLSGDQAVAAVFWAAAGRPAGAGGARPPIPGGAWVDETGVWRNGVTNRPLAAVLTGGGGSGGRAPLRDPNQYEDLAGELRWVDTNELVSQRPNRDWYQDDAGVWRWSDTRQPVDVPPTLAVAARLRDLVQRSGGRLQIIGSQFSESEIRAASHFIEAGRTVVLREAPGEVRTSDLLVDGVDYDVYTPQRTTSLNNIVRAISKKRTQVRGGGVVLDLSESELTGVDAEQLLRRVRGLTSNISDIVIIGNE